MKRTIVEKSTVVVLFILVLVVFSFAERDSKILVKLYTKEPIVDSRQLPHDYLASGTERAPEFPPKLARN